MTEISDMLLHAEIRGWAVAISKLADEMDFDPKSAKKKVLHLYGGMGSFNDIVLYKDGVLLINQNEQLDFLKSRLFELCQE